MPPPCKLVRNGVHIVHTGGAQQQIHGHAGDADEQDGHQRDAPLQGKTASFLLASHQIALADAVADGVIAQHGAELFAQGGDMDANGIAEAVHAVVPNVIHQLLLTHGPPLMHHQVFEYPRFLAGQRQRLPIDGGGAGAVSKLRPPQLSSTSCWVNCLNVRLRMRASSSAR